MDTSDHSQVLKNKLWESEPALAGFKHGFTGEKNQGKQSSRSVQSWHHHEHLPTDGHMPGRMLRAPQRMESQPSKSALAFTLGHLLLIADIQQLALGGAEKIASTLLKSQLSWPKCSYQVIGNTRTKPRNVAGWDAAASGRTAETVMHSARWAPNPDQGSSRSERRGAADLPILHPGKGNFSSRVSWCGGCTKVGGGLGICSPRMEKPSGDLEVCALVGGRWAGRERGDRTVTLRRKKSRGGSRPGHQFRGSVAAKGSARAPNSAGRRVRRGPGITARHSWGKGWDGHLLPTDRQTHTHAAPLPAGSESPPRALRTQPGPAAAAYPRRGTGSPTRSSAWWASQPPPQVGP